MTFKLSDGQFQKEVNFAKRENSAYWEGSLKGCRETKKELLELVDKKIKEFGDIRPLREIKQYLEE
ncbi:MAG: hypothetical protein ACOC1X_02430 [Promethearchaeota archaeon]